MKKGLLQALCFASAFGVMGAVETQAQVTIGLTGPLRSWDYLYEEEAGYLNRVSIRRGLNDLSLDGPYRYDHETDRYEGPIRMDMAITIPFTGILRFTYIGVSWDTRGWGDGAGTLYESIGYSINGVDYQLSPDSGDGTGGIYSDNLLYTDGEQETVFLREGDYFTFYLTSSDSLGAPSNDLFPPGEAHLYAQDFTFTAVPEPGEWMAMAGVCLIGFAGVRRWRKNHALNG